MHQSKTFCMHPFTGLATREDGAIQVCCRSHPIGNVQCQSLEDIWNNNTMKRIRQQVLNNERPKECEPCFSLEDQGVESLRQRHIEPKIPESRVTLYPDALNKLNADYTMPFEIPTMELKLNNLCNLKCRMCHPMDSTSWNDWKEVEEFYVKENNFMVQAIKDLNLANKPYLDKFTDNPEWWSNLEKLLPYFRRVEFAGGEPLMDPTHYKILDMLKPYGHQIEIKYATNGTTTGIKGGRNIHDYWPHFKSVAVNVSIDGLDASYEYIRGNGVFNDVAANIKVIQAIPNVSRVVGAVAVQVSNIMILDRMIEKFLDEMDIVFYTNMVKYPNVLSIQAMPMELKQVAALRLHLLKDKIPDYKMIKKHPILEQITRKQIEGVVNFMFAKDESHLWQDTIEFNKRLDASRSQSFTDVTPEFKPYV